MRSNQPSVPLRRAVCIRTSIRRCRGWLPRELVWGSLPVWRSPPHSPSPRSADWFVYSNCAAHPLSLTTAQSVSPWYAHITLLRSIAAESIVNFVSPFSGDETWAFFPALVMRHFVQLCAGIWGEISFNQFNVGERKEKEVYGASRKWSKLLLDRTEGKDDRRFMQADWFTPTNTSARKRYIWHAYDMFFLFS